MGIVRLKEGDTYPGPKEIGSIELEKVPYSVGNQHLSLSAEHSRAFNNQTFGTSYEFQRVRDYHGMPSGQLAIL